MYEVYFISCGSYEDAEMVFSSMDDAMEYVMAHEDECGMDEWYAIRYDGNWIYGE